MSEKPIYCGSGRKQNDSWLKVTINPDKIMDHIQTYEGNKFIKLNINIKDEPDQYGKDVSISVDTWKPNKKDEEPEEEETQDEPVLPETNDDLPFN